MVQMQRAKIDIFLLERENCQEFSKKEKMEINRYMFRQGGKKINFRVNWE